jgi:hypothetical protein
VRSGEQGASLAMALLAGLALLCYIGTLALVSPARRRAVETLPPPSPAQPDDPTPPWPDAAWPDATWPDAVWSESPGGRFSKLVVPARRPPPPQTPTSWFTPE